MPRSTAPQPDFAEPTSPWTRPGFLIAAAVIVLIVVAGIVIAVSRGGSKHPVQGATVTAGPSTGGGTSTAAPPTAIPTIAPAGVTWSLVGQSAVPVSRSAGPREVTPTTATGFAHSPEGALIAAAQLSIRAGYSAGRKSWEPTITNQFAPSADRDLLLAGLKAQPEPSGQPGDLSPLAGYIYQSYTVDTAVIGLVYRTAAGASSRYFVVSNTLVWRDGDWQMVAPPGGSWRSLSRSTNDLIGVVEWGAR
jgi:hypothetical protein